MRTMIRAVLCTSALCACAEASRPTLELPERGDAVVDPVVAAHPPAPKSEAERTVADIAVGSPDHTTLVAALDSAGLVRALASPGGIYTVFAPTNAAFDALPAGTVEGLLKPEKHSELRLLLQHHAAVPILSKAQMKDGETLTMSDGRDVTFHVVGDEVLVDDAHILGEVHGVNGIVYVVDKILMPAS